MIKQNIGLSLSVKFVVAGLALAGYASLWAAIAADMGKIQHVSTPPATRPLQQRRKRFSGALGPDQRCAQEAVDVFPHAPSTDGQIAKP